MLRPRARARAPSAVPLWDGGALELAKRHGLCTGLRRSRQAIFEVCALQTNEVKYCGNIFNMHTPLRSPDLQCYCSKHPKPENGRRDSGQGEHKRQRDTGARAPGLVPGLPQRSGQGPHVWPHPGPGRRVAAWASWGKERRRPRKRLTRRKGTQAEGEEGAGRSWTRGSKRGRVLFLGRRKEGLRHGRCAYVDRWRLPKMRGGRAWCPRVLGLC